MSNPTTTIPRFANIPDTTVLTAILEADSISCEILRFLLQNETAMDSAKGIAAWWVHRDELAVQPSLNRLFACGAILAHTLTSGVTLYRLTQDGNARTWLRDALNELDKRPAVARLPVNAWTPLTHDSDT